MPSARVVATHPRVDHGHYRCLHGEHMAVVVLLLERQPQRLNLGGPYNVVWWGTDLKRA